MKILERYHLLFTIFCLHAIPGLTQVNLPFPPDGEWSESLIQDNPTWSVLKVGRDSTGAAERWSTIFFLGTDTLIDGRFYKKLYDTRDSIVDPTAPENQYQGAVREEHKVVTFIRPGSTAIDTLYNFNLKEGDIFRTGTDDVGQPFEVFVQEIDTVETEIGSSRRFFLHSREIREDSIYVSTTPGYIWVEGIGDLERGILSPNCNTLERNYNCLNTLLCHHENDTLVYQNKAYESCFLRSTSTSFAGVPGLRIRLFPNPASGFLNIIFDPGERPAKGQFRVLDAQGRIVKRFEPLPGETTYLLPLAGYSPGVYFLQYLEDGKIARATRFVVQRR